MRDPASFAKGIARSLRQTLVDATSKVRSLISPPSLPAAPVLTNRLTVQHGLLRGELKLPDTDEQGLIAVLHADAEILAAASLIRHTVEADSFHFTIQYPPSALSAFRGQKIAVSLARIGELQRIGGLSRPRTRRFSAEDMLASGIGKPAAKREPLGIIVFGHTQWRGLELVLESLRRQQCQDITTVWLDGAQDDPVRGAEVARCEETAREKGFARLVRYAGHIGPAKLALHGLMHMVEAYESVIVLDETSFPIKDAPAIFLEELERQRGDPSVLTVYGQHFGLDREFPRFTRFQTRGWAADCERLAPYLLKLAYVYSLPEDDYLIWVREQLTPPILDRIDATPPRLASAILAKFFTWDEMLGLLAAIDGKWHVPTKRRAVQAFACGAGEPRTLDRAPPYGMIAAGEVWGVYDHA